MGRLPALILLSIFLLAFDYYCYRAVLSVFKKWKPATKKLFSIIWWTYTGILVIGVFAAIYVPSYLPLYLSLRSVILVAFFLTLICKVVMLPFLLVDDIRRLIIKISRYFKYRDVAGSVEKVVSTKIIEEPISRSSFIIKAGLLTAAVPLTSLTWGISSGAYDYKIKRRTLILPNLPRAFEGVK